MTRSERGSATIHTLLAALLLVTALAAATLWSTISTARHKLTTAADLTALSAAQSLATAQSPATAQTLMTAPIHTSLSAQRLPSPRSAAVDQPSAVTPPVPCETAARTATLNKVQLSGCDVTDESVTVQVSLGLNLPVGRPTLSATARAGPL